MAMRFPKNMNGTNNKPATTATQPVRPPAATPDPDSMYVVADEADGTELRARMILSNADPKRTFLGLLDAKELPEDFLFAVRGRARSQLVLKARDRSTAIAAVGDAVDALSRARKLSGASISVDVDPQ